MAIPELTEIQKKQLEQYREIKKYSEIDEKRRSLIALKKLLETQKILICNLETVTIASINHLDEIIRQCNQETTKI